MKIRFLLARDCRTEELKQHALLLAEETAHQRALREFRKRVANNIRRRITDGRFNPRNLEL